MTAGLLVAAQGPVPEIEPAELTRNADLLGREVVVDGRVQGTFAFHKGRGFDEFRLQKSPATFVLPPRLITQRPPVAPAIRARGVLKKQGERYIFEVTSMEIQPSDLERLERDTAALQEGDAARRHQWAAWAERRSATYGDEALLARARELEGEALRIESQKGRSDAAKALTLAERAKERQVPEPERSALAHGALRSLLNSATTVEQLEKVMSKIDELLPRAKSPTGADISRWKGAYANDPSGAYRQADDRSRAGLDRLLWADSIQKSLELRFKARPTEGLKLAEEAEEKIPDRPQVAVDLQKRGLDAVANDVGSMRQSEVEEFAKIYAEKLNQPDRAKELIRRWLDDQRANRLSRDDAEGRVLLAGQYESMLGDQRAAVALLREAWKIDPQSKTTEDVFRRKGFRLVDGEWQGPTRSGRDASADATPDEEPDPATRPKGRDPLIGLTRVEVRNLMGKPDRIVRSRTQGQLLEQWIYQRQYINFVKQPGMSKAEVVSHHSTR
jgi:hypothetical protein